MNALVRAARSHTTLQSPDLANAAPARAIKRGDTLENGVASAVSSRRVCVQYRCVRFMPNSNTSSCFQSLRVLGNDARVLENATETAYAFSSESIKETLVRTGLAREIDEERAQRVRVQRIEPAHENF